MTHIKILLLYISIYSFSALSSPVLYQMPGLVPLKTEFMPAVDLIYKGKMLMPNEALRLKEQGIDISKINPIESDVWQNHIGTQTEIVNDQLGIYNQDEVEFVDTLISPTGGFRFVIKKTFPDGLIKTYTVFVHKRAHTYLLRKELLRKLGYKVPAMKRLAKVTIKFKGLATKGVFLGQKIKEKCDPDEDECDYDLGNIKSNAGGIERWVTNYDDKETPIVEMQDVIIMNADEPIYNLALTPGGHNIMAGRRVFNSLLLPYNLVDVRESVNGLFYYSVRKYNNALYFPLEENEEFMTSLDDAKWMGRRIEKLTRKDFKEIVNSAELPDAVSTLLLEKLVSRRNEMLKQLGIEYEEMSFNPNISLLPDLKEGVLIKKSWSGYGSNFSYGEQPSPISGPEIKAFFRSKAISSILNELIVRANKDFMPHTKIEKAIIAKQKELVLDQVVDYLITGEKKDIPFGYWTEPTFSGSLILSREVVAGSYLGTDNRIQLADTIGYAVDAGVYVGTHGLPTNVSLDAQAKAYWTRTYSHLRPLASIKAANAEPFKNILVPILKRQYGGVLDELAAPSFAEKTPEEQRLLAEQVAVLFKEELGDGESIIISDNVGGLVNARAGYRFDERVKLQIQAGDRQAVISRLHITRRGHEIQVYKDLGNVNTFSVAITFKAGIQLLHLGYNYSRGEAKVKFYKANIAKVSLRDGQFIDNEDLIPNLLAVREVLINNDVELMGEFNKPFIIKHKFSEHEFEKRFLFWASLGVISNDNISILYPGESVPFNLVKQSYGKRWGRDYQSLGVDVLNFLLEEYTHSEGGIVNTISGDPGDTLFGSSKARNVVYEAEQIDEKNGKIYLVDNFARVSYRWKGWKASKTDAIKLIAEIEREYGFEFYPDQVMALTKDLELYIVSLNLNIYERGIETLSRLKEEDLIYLLENFSKNLFFKGEQEYDRRFRQAKLKFLDAQKEYNQGIANGNSRYAAKKGAKMVDFIEQHLTREGIVRAVGGEDNLYIYSTIDGFKVGEDGENAEKSLYSSDVGEFGSKNPFGPLDTFRKEMGISESEFYIYWILRKL